MLFLGFGENGENEVSQWSLWNDQILWRIELNQQVLAGSEDDRERMEVAAQQINGRTLVSGETDDDSGDSLLTFSGGLTLRTFLVTAEDNPTWNLSSCDSESAIPRVVRKKQEPQQ